MSRAREFTIHEMNKNRKRYLELRPVVKQRAIEAQILRFIAMALLAVGLFYKFPLIFVGWFAFLASFFWDFKGHRQAVEMDVALQLADTYQLAIKLADAINKEERDGSTSI